MEDCTPKERKCVRYLSNEMSKEDRLIFEIELSIDDELQLLFNEYKKLWIHYPIEKITLDKRKAPHNFHKKKQSKFSQRKILYFSSILILAVLAGAITVLPVDSPSPTPTTLIITDLGEQKQFFLPDSSKVVLNSKSTLRFSQSFSKPREVWLDGEAFFEIRKNTKNPFIVRTNEIDVEVKGTSFGINTSAEKQTVSLESGRVTVHLKSTKDEVNLRPNEQLIWNKYTNEVIKKKFDSYKELAWKEDKLVFKNTPFSQAVLKINDFYGVNFNIDSNTIKNQQLTGVFKRQSLEEFIAALEFITDVKIIKESAQQFTIIAFDEN